MEMWYNLGMENSVSIDDLKIENASLKAELAETRKQLDWLIEQLSSAKRKLFEPSSEKSVYLDGSVQLGLFPDKSIELAALGSPETISPDGQAQQNRKPVKRGEMGTRLPPDLPIETIEVELPEEQRECPQGHGPMRPIGKELVRREVKITPASVTVIEYVRHSYACEPCEKVSVDAPLIVKAELPPQVIKGSMCSPETVAHIAVQKCVMGSPLYRQEQEFKRGGIPLARQVMASWLIRCSEDYLEPIYDALHRQLCSHKFMHSDGTTFQVLREPGKDPQSQSCMWVYRTSCDAANPIVLYEYQPDKKQVRAYEFLEGFAGYLMTDGSSSYNGLPDCILLVGCFSHTRRYFFDALKCLKEQDRPGSLALVGKEYCDKIFMIERDIKDKTYDERYAIRNEKAAPVLDEFKAWLDSVQAYVAPKSKLGKAVTYALNQWEYLIRYLLDGRIECSNNRCERSVKPFVINRKNFLFATSVAGAKAAAVLHSITETAKESGLDPFKYLTHIFRTAAGVKLREDPALVNALMPENAPPSCRALLPKNDIPPSKAIIS